MGAVAPKTNAQNKVGDNTFYTKISTHLPNHTLSHSTHHIFTITAVTINSLFHILSKQQRHTATQSSNTHVDFLFVVVDGI